VKSRNSSVILNPFLISYITKIFRPVRCRKALGALGDPGAIDYLIEMLSENGIMRGWVANHWLLSEKLNGKK
jgi:hypothetical protein